VDPHKRSGTIEVVDEQGTVLATGRFARADSVTEYRAVSVRELAPNGCSSTIKDVRGDTPSELWAGDTSARVRKVTETLWRVALVRWRGLLCEIHGFLGPLQP
jgi:hypothetical protein